MAIIGEAFVAIRPESTGFFSSLKGKMAAQSGAFGAIGGTLGLAAAVGVAGGLIGIGQKFDSTYNAIKVKTGATGKVFDGLKTDVKAVLGSTAGSFEQVGAAISGLYTRTGLTGSALDQLAKQQVTLGRITKTDVGENVDATTKLFAKYGVAAGDQSKHLDVLFKASQQAGVGIDKILQPLAKSGAALQQFGFNVDQSAALVASLTKAGINVQPALGALTKAFGSITKEGGDPRKVFQGLQRDLQGGKKPAEAMAEAMKLLGNRGGLELATAIKSGKFNLDDMLKTITDGKGGILETGSSVSTLGGKFALLKNKALVAIEPIATALTAFANKVLKNVITWFDKIGGFVGIWDKFKVPILILIGVILLMEAPIILIGTAFVLLYQRSETFRNVLSAVASWITGRLIPAVQSAAEWLGNRLGEDVRAISAWFSGTLVPALQQVAEWLGEKLGPALQQVSQWMSEHTTAVKIAAAALGVLALALVSPVAFVALLVGAIIDAYIHFEGFRNVVKSVMVWFKANVVPVIRTVVDGIVKAFSSLVKGVRERWGDIQKAIHNVLAVIKIQIALFLLPILIAWKLFHNQILSVLQTAWTLIKTIVMAALQVLRGIIDVVLGLLSGDWGRVWNGIKAIVSGVWQAMLGIVKAAVGQVVAILSAGLSLLGAIWNLAWTGIKNAVSGVWHGIIDSASTAINQIVGFFGGLAGRLLGFVGAIAGAAGAIGGAIVNGIVNGLRSAAGFVENLAGQIRDAFVNIINGQVIDRLNSAIGSISFSIFGHHIGLPDDLIPHLAKGAFVTGPTLAMIGENRSSAGEFVSPVEQLRAVMTDVIRRNPPRSGAGGARVDLTLAPVFPPGMDHDQAMAELKAWTMETLAETFDNLDTDVKSGAGAAR